MRMRISIRVVFCSHGTILWKRSDLEGEPPALPAPDVLWAFLLLIICSPNLDVSQARSRFGSAG